MKLPRRPYLTTRAHEAFSLAFDAASHHGQDEVTPTHVTLGILREGRGVAVAILHQHGVPLDALARDLEAALPATQVAARPTVSAYGWTAPARAVARHGVRAADIEADLRQLLNNDIGGQSTASRASEPPPSL